MLKLKDTQIAHTLDLMSVAGSIPRTRRARERILVLEQYVVDSRRTMSFKQHGLGKTKVSESMLVQEPRKHTQAFL